MLHHVDYFLLSRYGRWLFDAEFYHRTNSDVVGDPLRHYVNHGRYEGRDPQPYFDTDYYIEHHLAGIRQAVNPLLHFLLFGRARHLSPSIWFDYGTYLRSNNDVRVLGIDPFRHFVEHGVNENRTSTPAFNPGLYLENNPDVAASGIPALVHYLRYGERESRAALTFVNPLRQRDERVATEEAANFEAELLRLASELRRAGGARRHVSGKPVDVIIPVYKGREATVRCLLSAASAKNRTPHELIVVDDASPEPGLAEALQQMAAAGLITLVRNEANEGFVRSVNRGMALHPERDVILLNSDTEVFGDWVDRLVAAASIAPEIGTVTPLTNSGTICSYPMANRDNLFPLEIDYRSLDRLARTLNKGVVVTIPTAVGFCMYVKRRVLEAVGLFDAETFGTGYGEENDFCLRAQAAGFVDVAAPSVFVRHLGSTSFGAQRGGRVAKATEIINKRYPGYDARIQAFVKEDPLAKFRGRLDRARLVRLKRKRNVLIISHERGGGTEQAVIEATRRLEGEASTVYRMAADMRRGGRAMHYHPLAPDVPNLASFDLRTEATKIIALWRSLRISEVHIHHLADFGSGGAGLVHELLRASGLPWRMFVHDYMAICPRISLSDTNGHYCGEPESAEACQSCLRTRRSEFGVPSIVDWRASHGALLKGAVEIVVPSDDARSRLRRYYGEELAISVEPHDSPIAGVLPARRRQSSRLRVGVIGAISKIKGFHVICNCARHAARTRLPIDFIVLGFTEDDPTAEAAGIEVSGPYKSEKLLSLIHDYEIDLIFLSSLIPETYSYVTSTAIVAGLPMAAFDIGAIASRIRDLDRAKLLSLETARDPAALNHKLIAHAASCYMMSS